MLNTISDNMNIVSVMSRVLISMSTERDNVSKELGHKLACFGIGVANGSPRYIAQCLHRHDRSMRMLSIGDMSELWDLFRCLLEIQLRMAFFNKELKNAEYEILFLQDRDLKYKHRTNASNANNISAARTRLHAAKKEFLDLLLLHSEIECG